MTTAGIPRTTDDNLVAAQGKVDQFFKPFRCLGNFNANLHCCYLYRTCLCKIGSNARLQ